MSTHSIGKASAPDVETKAITIDGQQYQIRRFGGRGRDAIRRAATDMESTGVYWCGAVACAHGLQRDPGKQFIDEIYDYWDPVKVVQPLAEAVMEYNGMSDDAEETEAGNSDASPS